MTRQGKKMAPVPTGPFPFSYEDFSDWYDRLSPSLWQPAQGTFTRLLNEILDQELSDADRLRIRVSNTRIKDVTRLWNKMLQARYVSKIQKLDDVVSVVDDIIGVRVTCNNLIDVEIFKNIVVALEPFDPDEMPAGLCIDADSERNHAKESGYRAYHINLHTLIQARDGWKHARGELQVRTLLQDSWGELTHEDTYKPGSSMPQIVNKFAKRMADLLATVDDLAQDLRTELDDLAQHDALGEPTDTPAARTSATSDGRILAENVREALVAEARMVIQSLTKPAPLAQVAWQVQANFGREVTEDWGGYGTFKALLIGAVPDVQILDVPPGTVLPSRFPTAVISTEKNGPREVDLTSEGVPVVVHRLRAQDANVPAIPAARLSLVLDAVTASLDPEVWDELSLSPGITGVRDINLLTKHARQVASDSEDAPSRKSLEYIFKSLYFSQNLRPALSKQYIGGVVKDYLLARASKYGLVLDAARESQELERWIDDACSS